jgi:FtsH ternary system domain X3-analog
MAEMTIKLQIDPATGKKNIVVSLSSDQDALPHEHEQQHRALVEKLIQGGIIKASELGKIIVQREEETPAPTSPVSEKPAEERRAQQQGGS